MIEREIQAYCQKTGCTVEEVRQRLEEGEPLQYILGEWEFYGLPMKVGPGVLIPQPDTEILVEQALPLLEENSRVLDLCSGSGCIAIALAENIGCRVVAVEKYDAALSYLRENIALNRVEHLVQVVQGDVLAKPSVSGPFDMIVSNPPYIPYSQKNSLPLDVLAEPHEALFADEDGLAFYHAMKEHWLPLLKPDGHFLFEIGYDQADTVRRLFADGQPRIVRDYGGNDRVIHGTWRVI